MSEEFEKHIDELLQAVRKELWHHYTTTPIFGTVIRYPNAYYYKPRYYAVEDDLEE